MFSMSMTIGEMPITRSSTIAVVQVVLTVSLLAGACLVLVGTKGRHPGWLGLLAAAALVWLAILRPPVT